MIKPKIPEIETAIPAISNENEVIINAMYTIPSGNKRGVDTNKSKICLVLFDRFLYEPKSLLKQNRVSHL